MGDIIINLQKSDTWKIQLTITTNFISSKDDDEEERVMNSNSNNIEFMSYDNANEVANELFNSLPFRYQAGLETSMRGSDFIFDSVQLLYYKCQRTNFTCGSLYIDSADWIRKEKATINPRNTDDNCFQYAGTVALKYEESQSQLEIV